MDRLHLHSTEIRSFNQHLTLILKTQHCLHSTLTTQIRMNHLIIIQLLLHQINPIHLHLQIVQYSVASVITIITTAATTTLISLVDQLIHLQIHSSLRVITQHRHSVDSLCHRPILWMFIIFRYLYILRLIHVKNA